MPVAEIIEAFCTADLESRLSISLRIQLSEFAAVISECRNERNIMLFAHLVGNRYVVLVFNPFNAQMMFDVIGFRLQRWQNNSTAADDRLSGALYHIPADRTDMQLHPQHIERPVGIDNILARKKAR